MEAVLSRQPVATHLSEVRRRLFRALGCLLAASAVGYVYRAVLLSVLLRPFKQPLFYTTPAGGFNFTLKLCLTFGLLLSIPVLVYHLLKFLQPALPIRGQKLLGRIVVGSFVLM